MQQRVPPGIDFQPVFAAQVDGRGRGRLHHEQTRRREDPGLERPAIEGQTVLEYNQPQLDDSDAHARELAKKNGGVQLTGGTISLQSESHPIEFRNIEVMEIE